MSKKNSVPLTMLTAVSIKIGSEVPPRVTFPLLQASLTTTSKKKSTPTANLTQTY